MSKRKPLHLLSTSERNCRAKGQYVSERVAKIYAERIGAQRDVRLSVYHCPHCKKWHLTSLPQAIDDFEVVA